MVGPFMLQRPEEPLHGSVVVTAAGATHRALDAQCLQRLLVLFTGIMTSTVTVMQKLTAVWSSCFNGVLQGLTDQIGCERGVDRPADDADYQIPFSFTGKLNKLAIKLDRPKLLPEDIEKLKQAERNNKTSE